MGANSQSKRCQLTDADLLSGARRGDSEAWRKLYERHLPSVWRQAHALVANVHAAEDITSETMLALLKGLDRLEADGSKVGAWLRTVVRCKAADHHRKVFRLRDKLPTANDGAADFLVDDCPVAPLEVAETRQHVLAVLDGMCPRQRTVLEWKYLDGLRVREMAERLGETEKAIETVLYRARIEFRRRYEQERFRAREVTRLPGTGSDRSPESS
jgi:RNA polymerase sigma-70 factor (ECF subfamily)